MSIGASFTIQQRLWRGFADPGLPVGVYIGAAEVTGDAGGGVQFLDFDFKGEGEPVSGRYYNLEQLTSHGLSVTSFAGSMIAVNWDRTGQLGISDRIWALTYQSDGVSSAGLSQTGAALGGKMPVFLGRALPVRDSSTSVRVQTANVLGRVLSATIQGYIWEARSVMVDGGLRRPVEAVFG